MIATHFPCLRPLCAADCVHDAQHEDMHTATQRELAALIPDVYYLSATDTEMNHGASNGCTDEHSPSEMPRTLRSNFEIRRDVITYFRRVTVKTRV